MMWVQVCLHEINTDLQIRDLDSNIGSWKHQITVNMLHGKVMSQSKLWLPKISNQNKYKNLVLSLQMKIYKPVILMKTHNVFKK
jgi:hypothetical protein